MRLRAAEATKYYTGIDRLGEGEELDWELFLGLGPC